MERPQSLRPYKLTMAPTSPVERAHTTSRRLGPSRRWRFLAILDSMGVPDLVATVEAAYQLVDDDEVWLKGICKAAAPLLDNGLGVVGWMVNPWQPLGEWQSSPVVVGASLDFREAVLGTGRRMSSQDIERMYLYGPGVGTISQFLGVPTADDYEPAAPYATKLGVRDFLGVRALDPSVGGCFFGAPLQNPSRANRPFIATWGRIGAHVAAALRLRRALATGAVEAPNDDAILDLQGDVHHAEGAAKASKNLEALRSAAQSIDRARGALGRTDPAAAVAQWQALVAGTWSLVDRFESDGRHFLIARTNAPDALDPRALSPQERVICRYIVAGHSNKLIAYSLGISAGTSSALTARAFRKLGVRSRIELVRMLAGGSEARSSELEIKGERLVVRSDETHGAFSGFGLTPSECEVASLAVAGKSNAEIATVRNCSDRTVANLARSLYRKLGISSRNELVTLLYGRQHNAQEQDIRRAASHPRAR